MFVVEQYDFSSECHRLMLWQREHIECQPHHNQDRHRAEHFQKLANFSRLEVQKIKWSSMTQT